MTFMGHRVWAVEVIGVLLFIGAMGKSAQFFLHVWLPDAMEGPTPVSALIHAATMVTAGVYLVCLMSPLYQYTVVAAGMITLIGAVTALYAATVGMAQNDIKRVIAYSTCSQLGYMFFAAGVGAYEAAMFHLFTHAFFKALLFLGAGSVIHGMHHEQDMRKMGGLAKFMPFTYAAMMIGTIAIIGLGIPHTKIGFSGFFSKDAILESAFAGGMEHVSFAQLAFWFGIVAAFLTSFYSWRLIYMTFHGPMASQEAHEDHGHAQDDHAAGHDDHGHGHDHKPHESPLVMLIPLGLLSLGAIFAGFYFYNYFVDHSNEAFWAGAIYRASDNHVLHARHEVPDWVIYLPLVVTLGGLLLATMTYFFNRGVGKRIAESGGPLYSLFYNKWYFDEIYQATLIRGAAFLGNIFWKADKKVIDGAGADGMTALTLFSARRLSALHTGRLYHYAFVIIGAALVFGALMWLNAGGAN
jgi:NADH-quinone oxidoreductase subunit L